MSTETYHSEKIKKPLSETGVVELGEVKEVKEVG